MSILRDIRIWLQYIIPFTVLAFTNVSQEWQVTDTDGGPERLYGFPLPYGTSAYACTMCNGLFALPLLIDLAFYGLAAIALVLALGKWGIPLQSRPSTIWLAMFMAACAVFFQFTGSILLQDNYWHWWIDFPYAVNGRSLFLGPVGF